MNVKEAVRTGIKAASVASLFFVPGCKVSPRQTVETFPQAATVEPARPTRTPLKQPPDFVDDCFPAKNEGFIIVHGIKHVSTGKKKVIVLQTASGEYETYFQGQEIPATGGQLLLCRKIR